MNNLNLTTTRGDRLTEAHAPLCGGYERGFDQPASYTTPGTQTLVDEIRQLRTW